jgi:hypothetical protein
VGAQVTTAVETLEQFVCRRLEARGKGWGYGGTADAVSFRCSESVCITGFGCFGGNGHYSVDIKLVEGNTPAGNVMGETPGLSYEADDGEPQHVFFDEPIEIEADQVYTAVCKITAGHTSYSGGGVQRVEGEDGTVFNFEGTSGATNGTSASGGQIPHILYAKRVRKMWNRRDTISRLLKRSKNARSPRTTLRRRVANAVFLFFLRLPT